MAKLKGMNRFLVVCNVRTMYDVQVHEKYERNKNIFSESTELTESNLNFSLIFGFVNRTFQSILTTNMHAIIFANKLH